MLRRQRIALVAMFALISSAPSANAESDSQPSGSTDIYTGGEAMIDATDKEPPGRPLSLAEAIAQGLQNNLDVEVNRYSPYITRLDSEAAWGAYDPLFNGDVGYADLASRNTFGINPVLRNQNDAITGGAGITALIPYWGATLNVDFDGRRDTTNSRIEALSPKYESGLLLGASVPLLRGLIWNQPWTQVKSSKLGYEADLDGFTTSVMDTVQTIISAYWNLVATEEQVRVAVKSLESTLALLDQSKTQYDVGVVSKVEVVEAEAGVANSEFGLIVARNAYHNAQDQLIATVLGDQIRAATTLTFDPTDNPGFTRVGPVDLEKAVATAFEKRPELAAAARRVDQGEVQLKYAKNQRLPQLDIGVSYRTAGVDGLQNPNLINIGTGMPLPPGSVVEGNFDDTFGRYYTSSGNSDLRAGGTISIPLGNVTARKNVSKARIELRRANSQIVRLEQQIVVAVRRAARGLLASAQGVEAAERRRLAAEEQLRAETIRLEHGESTPYQVLLRESDLVDAESQKIQALQAFRNSQAELERQQGTILDTWNVSIDNVRQLEYEEPVYRRY